MSTIRYLNLFKSFNQSKNLIRIAPRWSNKTLKRNFFTSGSFKNSNSNQSTEGEQKLIDLLRARFPAAKSIEVVDISGGCGAMYTIYVESEDFKNLRTVKQHQLVNECLRNEIKENMHGLRIQTAVPK
ncbi:bolA 3 [Brachionus plicatilis]|uniref:BolA 3 n=1 Tax=Brachionus plicatilis TaxID=10195 RepID=A0A3M7RWT1_BRAPC|nr:bolA 3 [Brachionus plicatilis]